AQPRIARQAAELAPLALLEDRFSPFLRLALLPLDRVVDLLRPLLLEHLLIFGRIRFPRAAHHRHALCALLRPEGVISVAYPNVVFDRASGQLAGETNHRFGHGLERVAAFFQRPNDRISATRCAPSQRSAASLPARR